MKKNPKTSIAAYYSISLHSKQAMWAKIIKALRKIKVGGTYQDIANKIGVEPVIVARRLNELVQKEVVYNTGQTKATSTGRKAMVRQLKKKYLEAA